MYEIYDVKENDTLEKIANNYGTTVGILMQLNGIVNNDISSLSRLIVPVLKRQPYQYYTVKKGDNMLALSKMFGVDYWLLLQLNGLDDGDYIYPNQTIMVPKDGVGIYMTVNDDTLDDVSKKIGISIDDLIKENENIYLLPDQILDYKENDI